MVNITKHCEVCGKEFTSKHKETRYCSRACINTATKTLPTRFCEICGNPILSKFNRSKAKYCSQKCTGIAHDQKITNICQICGKKFKVSPSNAATKFCSKKCHNASMDQKIMLQCQHCGKEFKVSPCFKNRKYCSQNCMNEVKPAYRIFRDKLKNGIRTNIESITENALQTLKINYVWEHRFGKYWVDFYLPEHHLAIECDEPYWHNTTKDARKDQYIIENYDVKILRLTTQQIKGGQLTDLIQAFVDSSASLS